MLWFYGRYEFLNSFSAGIVFRRQNRMSIYRCQILTSKDDTRTERIRKFIMAVEPESDIYI